MMTVDCPHCGEAVAALPGRQKQRRECPHCKAVFVQSRDGVAGELKAVLVAAPPPPPAESARKRKPLLAPPRVEGEWNPRYRFRCNACGRSVSVVAYVCPKCGHPIRELMGCVPFFIIVVMVLLVALVIGVWVVADKVDNLRPRRGILSPW